MSETRKPAISLLIIDDNLGSLELLSSALPQPGLEILTASDPKEGLEIVHRHRPQIVLTDLVMPHLSGLEVLERIMEFDPSIDVILMTAHYSTESAVEAIKKGATDYLNKPISISTLRERVGKLIEEARRRQHAIRLEDELLASSEFEGIIGRSPLMWDLFSQIRRVAPHYRSLLVTGPTGAGKDLVAQAIHRRSPAHGGRYAVLNCSAVVETLFESELFGHVRGSFTGATADKPGMFEHAHGGTLFLDEVGDMPLTTQAKLLRVLQNQEVQRVGSLTTHKVDVRVIAATNHDLRAAIREKRFREDLYYRLSMVELRVPPLADRKEDLPLLKRYFLSKFASQYGKDIRGVTHRVRILLALHSWPGTKCLLCPVACHHNQALSASINFRDCAFGRLQSAVANSVDLDCAVLGAAFRVVDYNLSSFLQAMPGIFGGNVGGISTMNCGAVEKVDRVADAIVRFYDHGF